MTSNKMSPDEYLIVQETNKRIAELSLNQSEQNEALREMQKAEMLFLSENLDPVSVSQTIEGHPYTYNTALKPSKQLASANSEEQICIGFKKATPDNVLEGFRDEAGNPMSDDLMTNLRQNPAILQKLCDRINEYSKAQCNECLKKLGIENEFDVVDDGNNIFVRRANEYELVDADGNRSLYTPSPGAKVEEIVDTAKVLEKQHSQRISFETNQNTTSKIEDTETKMTPMKP